MSKAILVAGLGFGDEGKGTITQYIADDLKANVVVRYNGGAQATHNVYSKDGKHHTFAQFGSATFEGVRTFLSKHVLVDPNTLFLEGRELISKGISDPYSLLAIDRDALLLTPYHLAANRLRELGRGAEKHGSCGIGIGEAMRDFIIFGTNTAPTMEDLSNPAELARKLSVLQEMKWEEFKKFDLAEVIEELPPSHKPTARRAVRWLIEPVWRIVESYSGMTNVLKLVDAEYLKPFLENGTVVFEGAQGMLLDQDFGFLPHVTWTDITFNNAMSLLNDAEFTDDIWKVGVMRTYMTRHGIGPLPTEIDLDEPLDKHNSLSLWQGNFRVGNFDTMLCNYALSAIGGVDEIALTHTDQRTRFDRICTGYIIDERDREDSEIRAAFGLPNNQAASLNLNPHRPSSEIFQTKLTTAVKRAKPIYLPQPALLETFVEQVNYDLQTPIGIVSDGPMLQHKNRL